jgi:hypothetical protein
MAVPQRANKELPIQRGRNGGINMDLMNLSPLEVYWLIVVIGIAIELINLGVKKLQMWRKGDGGEPDTLFLGVYIAVSLVMSPLVIAGEHLLG